MLGKDFAGLIR